MNLSVMHASNGTVKDLNNTDFIYEPKLDGYRALCYVDKKLSFISRNDYDLTPRYPELSFRSSLDANSCILDGEIVALDKKGIPSFSLLQQGSTTTFMVFDILMLNGKLLTDKPLLERKAILDTVVKPAPHLQKILYTENGTALWKEIKKYNLEGVVAKQKNGHYYPGIRTKQWLKIKISNTADCVILGYTSTGSRLISSLVLGLYDAQGVLRYAGKVGTGFTESFLSQLYQAASMIKIPTNPSYDAVQEKVQWLKPVMMCEIKYLEITSNGVFRDPVFIRMRFDKKPEECTITHALTDQAHE